MTMNVHTLLHIASTVEELGPLWAYSCFSFEGINGVLLKQVHGTQGIALQCMRTYSMIQAIPSNELIPPESQLGELRFVKEVMTAAKLLPGCSKEAEALGKYISVDQLTEEEKVALDNSTFIRGVQNHASSINV